MIHELARVGGPVAALGVAAVMTAPSRAWRLAGLAAWGLGALALALYLAPSGHAKLLAAAAVAGVVLAVAVAALLRRWPWLLALGALACVPARIRVTVGATDANLLVPLYGLVAAAALVLAYEVWRGDSRTRELGPLGPPLAALVAWSGFSLLWSQDLHEGAISLLFFYLPFALLAVALARLPWRREWLGALYALLAAMAVVFAAVGVWQYAVRDVFWNPKVIIDNAYAPFFRVNSVFWDPSIYGRFLVVAILASLVLALDGVARRIVVTATAVIVAAWIGLLFSFSQSSFTALIVGVCIAAWLAWRRRALALIAGVAVVLLAAAIALPSVRHRSLNSASGGRSKLVSQGIQIAIHHPVAGVGIGAFKYAYARREHLRQRAPAVGASHNTPVTVAAETGVPGLLLFAWLLVSAFVLAFRRGAGRIAVAFGVILAAIAVHSLFYNAFFEDPVTWGAFGLVPLAIAAAEVRAFVSAPRRPAVAQQPAPDGARPGDRTRAEAG